MAPALDADVIVVGAGPSGAASALFAARGGRRVILLDSAQFPRDKPCGEGLMPSGRAPLRELGLEAIIAAGAPSLNGLKLGRAGEEAAAIPFPDRVVPGAGLGVRRIAFDQVLVEAARRQQGIVFQAETRALDVRTEPAPVVVITTRGTLTARHVVAADGLHSIVRQRLGWTRGPQPPHRYGVVGHWATEAPIDPWVRITFADAFEIYEGPVGGNQRMVAVLAYQAQMRRFAGNLAAEYREVVRAIRPEYGSADQVGPVMARGPFWYRARRVADRGVFLVGDAAGFTDPITAEGLATGLRQAGALGAALDTPNPEWSYRVAHRRLTADPRRIARLFLRLTRTPALVDRGLATNRTAPEILTKLLGVSLGYWGFNQVRPREWLRIFTGR